MLPVQRAGRRFGPWLGNWDPKGKKNKKVECVLPNMFLLVCWTSGFWGQVVPCWKLSALLARLFRSKELYALLQKWLTSFSVEFSIFPSAGQCSHKFPFLDCGHPQLSEWEKVSCVVLSDCLGVSERSPDVHVAEATMFASVFTVYMPVSPCP